MSRRAAGSLSGARAHHLLSVSRRETPGDTPDGFPFSVPAIQALTTLELPAGVTFFVGENGSGKSTLLEGIAAASGLPALGNVEVAFDETLVQQRRLAQSFTLGWGRRTHRGFFLRAEDLFGFARRIARIRSDMQNRMAELDDEYQDRSAHAKVLASGPMRASLAEIERRYGDDVDARSHGEAFLALFRARLVPDGLYLLDEPEAALSAQSQLALLTMMLDAVADGSQLVIATHSPLLLAFPQATIYTFDTTPISAIEYDDIPSVRLSRDFLREPERYLRRLAKE